MSTETAREELAVDIMEAYFEANSGSGSRHWGNMADTLRTAGYRKPTILGYVVVDRDGGMVTGASYTNPEAAQFYADKWTADAKAGRYDRTYRVAEIVEPTA